MDGCPNLRAGVNWSNPSRGAARRQPRRQKIFRANGHGAVGYAATNSTQAIQRAVDACARAGGGIVAFRPGDYVTGAIFVKSGVNLRVDENVTLLGSQEDTDYPQLRTRVAGIEMKWPAALINVNEQKNVKISGRGTIDGRGKKWWDKYWNLRRSYEPQGLRWAAHYDAGRVRLMVVRKSPERGLCELRNITIENVRVVGTRRVFSASGLPEKPLLNVMFINVYAGGLESGLIERARLGDDERPRQDAEGRAGKDHGQPDRGPAGGD